MLPYRPEYAQGLAGVIKSINSEFGYLTPFINGLVSELADLRISHEYVQLLDVSWTLDAPNILKRFSASNKIMDMARPEYYGLFS